MPNLVGVTNYLPTVKETYSSTLSSSIAAGAATVPVVTASPYIDGDIVALTVDKGTASQATFTGTRSGNSYINCVWTEGNTAVGHAAGAAISDIDSATHYDMLRKNVSVHANQNGTLIAAAIRSALGVTAAAANGWELLSTTPTVSSGANKGNKEVDLLFSNADLSTTLTPGMRFKVDRTGTTPTQCFDAEASSSQFASKSAPTGITFTDDFTCEAWVKLESYVNGVIVSRFDATNGFRFDVNSDGTLRLLGNNAGAANLWYLVSYQSIPLNTWVHVAGTWDASGRTSSTNKIFVNGVDVPCQLLSGGTAPTSLVQAGNLQVGAQNSTSFFDGEIADVRIWNTIRTATQIRDNMNQQLVGNETGLVAYFKLNGNFNDSTANANDLTASGGAVATTLDNPMKTTEYGLVHKVTYSAPNTTVTVFTGTDHNIPNMTLANPYYSTQKVPYGFPADRGKWKVETLLVAVLSTGGVADTWYSGATTTSGSFALVIPVGKWEASFYTNVYTDSGGAATIVHRTTLSTSVSSESNSGWTTYAVHGNTTLLDSRHTLSGTINLDTATTHYLLIRFAGGLGNPRYGDTTTHMRRITAENAYI